MMMTNEDLIESAEAIIGGDVEELSFDQLLRLITTTQYLTDLCLNEIERRGELTFCDGFVVVPYHCDLMVQTVLTRPPRPEWMEEDPTPGDIHTPHRPANQELVETMTEDLKTSAADCGGAVI